MSQFKQWRYFLATVENGCLCWLGAGGEMSFSLEEGLSHLGEGGWELANTLDPKMGHPKRPTMIFKRPVEVEL